MKRQKHSYHQNAIRYIISFKIELQIRLCIGHISADDAAAHSSIEFIATRRSLFSIGLVRFSAMWSRNTYVFSEFVYWGFDEKISRTSRTKERIEESVDMRSRQRTINKRRINRVFFSPLEFTIRSLRLHRPFCPFPIHKFINHCRSR